jgi:hypothetical protein
MKKTLLAAIAVSIILASSMVTFWIFPAKADSPNSIYFPYAGLTIYSPVNTTYSENLVLNVSLMTAGNLGSVDPQISMTYSIDGVYNGSVPLASDGAIHVTTRAVGSVGLPSLDDGSHVLTIYLYGLNQVAYDPKYINFVETVSFSTTGNQAPSPTPQNSGSGIEIVSPLNTTYSTRFLTLTVHGSGLAGANDS